MHHQAQGYNRCVKKAEQFTCHQETCTRSWMWTVPDHRAVKSDARSTRQTTKYYLKSRDINHAWTKWPRSTVQRKDSSCIRDRY